MARKLQMPMSQGGLITYYDEDNSKINLKPGYLIILIILVLLFQLWLLNYGFKLLGLK